MMKMLLSYSEAVCNIGYYSSIFLIFCSEKSHLHFSKMEHVFNMWPWT